MDLSRTRVFKNSESEWRDSLFSKPVQTAIYKLDYLTLFQMDFGIDPQLGDRYFWVRSAIVLGRYDIAQNRIEQFPGVHALAHSTTEMWVKDFLAWQLKVYQSPYDEEVTKQMALLEESLPPCRFWAAELYFIKGFALSSIDEYRRALRFQRLALDEYASLGLPAFQAHSLFNLCVIFNHLNEPTLLEVTFKNLEKIHSELKCEATLLPLIRIRAYRFVDREEFSSALSDCETLIALCRAQGRDRDLGSIICLNLYLLVKTESYEKVNSFLSSIRHELGHLNEDHQQVVHEMVLLEQTGLLSENDSRRLFLKWKRLNIKSVHLLMLLSLMMDRLLKARDYSGLIKLARLSSDYSLRKEQALCLVDFRYYEILGLIRSGQLEAATTLLVMYQEDVSRDESEPKSRKLLELQSAVKLSRDRADWLVGNNFSSSMILSVSTRSVYFRGRKIDLSKKPVIQKLLLVLISHQNPIPLSQLFFEVYDQEYHPLRHDRRLHSLIDRTRRLLNDSSCLIREEGQIYIDPKLLARTEALPSADIGKLNKRRGHLLKSINDTGTPMTISEIEKLFPCSRRTLQFDLKALVHANLIRTSGGTRTRTYFVEKN